MKKKLPIPSTVPVSTIAQTAEALTDESLGKALFVLVAAARNSGLDPEGALRRYTNQIINDVEDAAKSAS